MILKTISFNKCSQSELMMLNVMDQSKVSYQDIMIRYHKQFSGLRDDNCMS